MLSWYPSQKRTSGSWSEDKEQCKNKKRSEENSCKQEEIRIKYLQQANYLEKKVG